LTTLLTERFHLVPEMPAETVFLITAMSSLEEDFAPACRPGGTRGRIMTGGATRADLSFPMSTPSAIWSVALARHEFDHD